MTIHESRQLYERDAELAVFDRLLDDAAGGGRLVLVEGPPGIGKTRLLAEARRRAPPPVWRSSVRAASSWSTSVPTGSCDSCSSPS
jgi:hypothetical protein